MTAAEGSPAAVSTAEKWSAAGRNPQLKAGCKPRAARSRPPEAPRSGCLDGGDRDHTIEQAPPALWQASLCRPNRENPGVAVFAIREITKVEAGDVDRDEEPTTGGTRRWKRRKDPSLA